MTAAGVSPNEPRRIAAGWLVALALVALAGVQGSCNESPAPNKAGDAEVKENGPAAESVADDVRIIVPPDAKEEMVGVRGELVVWPSADEIARKKAHEDRSQDFPAQFPPGVDHSDFKPIRLGAVAPEAALKEAEAWIRVVLKPKWVPIDLSSRLLALAEENPARSTVWCRYRIEGQVIQVGQTRGTMCVAVRPAETKAQGEAVVDFGRRCLGQFLTKSEGLLEGRMEAVPLKSPELSMFRGYSTKTRGDLSNWWGYVVWYTDGKAVAFRLWKRTSISAASVGRDTPWF